MIEFLILILAVSEGIGDKTVYEVIESDLILPFLSKFIVRRRGSLLFDESSFHFDEEN